MKTKAYSYALGNLVADAGESIAHIQTGPVPFDIGVVKNAHFNWKVQMEPVLNGRKKLSPEGIPVIMRVLLASGMLTLKRILPILPSLRKRANTMKLFMAGP